MSKDQMEMDLAKHTRSKLKKLMRDMIDLYETAGIPSTNGMAILTSEMVHIIVLSLSHATDMTPETFGKLMQKTFAAMRAETQGEEKAASELRIIEVELLHPHATPDMVGILPEFLDPKDPRPAREQLNENYAHGGGWSPMKGWRMEPSSHIMHYDDEVPLRPLARIRLRNESVLLYESSWVAIVQPNGEFEVSRMD
jgi:hypothetical protein